MEFRTVTIVKHPTALVWETMQGHLPEIAAAVPDIESVSPISSGENEEGHLLMVNVWKARPPLPDFLAKMVQPDMLTWTDSAVWKEAQRSCRWEIRSHYFKEQMSCIGNTTFEAAMGGKACRLSFEGTLHWQTNALPIKMAGPLVAQGIESFMASMIPANFRKLTEAVEQFIQNNKLV